jgi:predicted neutral ceramidase superfamily lipid hydrolase
VFAAVAFVFFLRFGTQWRPVNDTVSNFVSDYSISEVYVYSSLGSFLVVSHLAG